MALADGFGAELLAPVFLVALRARQVHLPHAPVIHRASGLEIVAVLPVDDGLHGHPARLLRDVGGQPQQFG